jgi:hypothetical protein
LKPEEVFLEEPDLALNEFGRIAAHRGWLSNGNGRKRWPIDTMEDEFVREMTPGGGARFGLRLSSGGCGAPPAPTPTLDDGELAGKDDPASGLDTRSLELEKYLCSWSDDTSPDALCCSPSPYPSPWSRS